jgi:GH35 family endo-1,4-beta-xylanase
MAWPLGLPEDYPSFPGRFDGQVETYTEKTLSLGLSMLGVNAGLKKEWFESDRFIWRSSVDSVAAFAHRNGMTMRGHVLVRPRVSGLPQHQRDLLSDEDAFRAQLKADMTEMLRHNDHIRNWDAINEPSLSTDLQNRYGTRILADILNGAHEIGPRNCYLVNEHTVITGNGPQTNVFYDRLVAIEQAGGLIGRAGFETHYSFRGKNKPMDSVYNRMERFAELVGPDGELWITELDTKYQETHEQSAQYIADIVTLGFSHPQMKGTIKWGIWENGVAPHFANRTSAFYDVDWNLKPQGKAWKDLVCGIWWTDTSFTVPSGTAPVDLIVFKGLYECEIASGSTTQSATFTCISTILILATAITSLEAGDFSPDQYRTALGCGPFLRPHPR